MSTTSSSLVCTSRRAIVLARLADYLELSKPRIASMVLVVVAVSAFVASAGSPVWSTLAHTLVGTALVAASASAFNQLIERRSDALMARTADRPLPGGRLHASETISFGLAALVLGGAYLALMVNFATALLGLVTWVLYVAVYTPLKSRTSANTAIGAVAGALPVLMGWSAAGASFSFVDGAAPGGLQVAALFLIVYLWQFPHFMAIAWIYRKDYDAAGLKMLTVVDPTGRRAGAQAVLGAMALVPIGLIPALHAPGRLYLVGTVALGAAYLAAAVMFCRRRDDISARGLLQASLIYLPAVLVLLMLAPWI